MFFLAIQPGADTFSSPEVARGTISYDLSQVISSTAATSSLDSTLTEEYAVTDNTEKVDNQIVLSTVSLDYQSKTKPTEVTLQACNSSPEIYYVKPLSLTATTIKNYIRSSEKLNFDEENKENKVHQSIAYDSGKIKNKQLLTGYMVCDMVTSSC